MSRALGPVPRWAVYLSWFLSLVGLSLSAYLTYEHFYQKVFQGCSLGGLVNCQKVTTSAQSHFLGIPVSVLGLATFVVFAVINSPWLWSVGSYWLHVARLTMVMGAMIFVLWLVYAELIIINNICLYCTGVHVVTFALFVIVMRVAPVQLGWDRSTPQ